MFAKVKQGVEKGQRKYDEMIRSMSIVSPMVDRSTGKPKVYTYTAAVEFATNIGLLTSEGQLDKRAMGKW